MNTTLTAAGARILAAMPMGEAVSNLQIVNALERDIRWFYSAKGHHAALRHLVDTGQVEEFTVEEGDILARYYRRVA